MLFLSRGIRIRTTPPPNPPRCWFESGGGGELRGSNSPSPFSIEGPLTSHAQGHKRGFSLEDIPPQHAVLTPAMLVEKGHECLNLLIALAKRSERFLLPPLFFLLPLV